MFSYLSVVETWFGFIFGVAAVVFFSCFLKHKSTNVCEVIGGCAESCCKCLRETINKCCNEIRTTYSNVCSNCDRIRCTSNNSTITEQPLSQSTPQSEHETSDTQPFRQTSIENILEQVTRKYLANSVLISCCLSLFDNVYQTGILLYYIVNHLHCFGVIKLKYAFNVRMYIN